MPHKRNGRWYDADHPNYHPHSNRAYENLPMWKVLLFFILVCIPIVGWLILLLIILVDPDF